MQAVLHGLQLLHFRAVTATVKAEETSDLGDDGESLGSGTSGGGGAEETVKNKL